MLVANTDIVVLSKSNVGVGKQANRALGPTVCTTGGLYKQHDKQPAMLRHNPNPRNPHHLSSKQLHTLYVTLLQKTVSEAYHKI